MICAIIFAQCLRNTRVFASSLPTLAYTMNAASGAISDECSSLIGFQNGVDDTGGCGPAGEVLFCKLLQCKRNHHGKMIGSEFRADSGSDGAKLIAVPHVVDPQQRGHN